tara:strand:- start:116 stop:265 length:150 start_codon:yes stop_codon:yes gene_type:complete
MVDISAIRKAIESDKPELLEKSQKNDKLRLIVYPLLLVIAFAVVYFLAP